jgi:hypothetical protein
MGWTTAYVSSLDSSIRNQPSSVPGLGTVGNDDRFNVSDHRIWAGLGGSKDTKVVHRVNGQETRV